MPLPHRDPVDRLRAVLLEDPAHTALLVDFDGTVAPIVDEPVDAVAAPGLVDVLDVLAKHLGRVAVVSGRPIAFLVDRLGPEVDLSGLYGLESRLDGVAATHPAAEAFRPRIQLAAHAASEHFADSGVVVESKGLSLTIHFRQAMHAADAVHGWASAYASDKMLELRPAKASIELHPPIPVDKGSVVHELAVGCRVVMYLGDDVGDLSAFAALDELRATGASTWKVAVRSPELPYVIEDAADVVIDGTHEVSELLAAVASAL